MQYVCTPSLCRAAAGVVALGVLWLQFRHAIPTQVALPALNPSDLLTDRRGALFGTINALSW